MKVSILLVFISIFLENIINLYFSNFKFLSPLFTLVSLYYINYNFKFKKNYFIFCLATGIIYDLIFTNFYILNGLLFLVISLLIRMVIGKKRLGLCKNILFICFIIIIYNLLLFLIFNFYSYKLYSFLEFIYILKYFFLGNIMYSVILYLLFKKRILS